MVHRGFLFGLALIVSACTVSGTYPGHAAVVVPGKAPLGIQVNGIGRAEAIPDVAVFEIGAEAHGPSVEAARKAAMGSQNAVLGALIQAGVPQTQIQTSQLKVTPDYSYSDQGRALKGYVVTNRAIVRLRDLSLLQPAIDQSLSAGGEAVWLNGLSFELSDVSEIEAAARRAAMQNARAKAEHLASLLGVRLGRPLAARDHSSQPDTPVPVALRRNTRGMPETAVEPGLSVVRVTLEVEWAIDHSPAP